MEDPKIKLARFLLSKIVSEERVLSSGRVSKYYLDFGMINTAQDLAICDDLLFSRFKDVVVDRNLIFNVLYGTSGTGAFFTKVLVSKYAQIRPDLFFSYGREKEIRKGSNTGYLDGHYLMSTDKVLIVDSAVSTGSKLEREAVRVTETGAKLSGFVVIFDRKERRGARYAIENLTDKFGVDVYSCVNVDDFISLLPENDVRKMMITQQQEMFGIKTYNFSSLDSVTLGHAIKELVRDLSLTNSLGAKAIVDLVSARTAISRKQIFSDSRSKGIVRARQIVMYLLRGLRLSFPEIGKILDRDHTSIIHGCRTIEEILRD